MINKQILREVLTDYKQDFDQRWKNEKFKWEAIKQFQDNWDPEAEDFGKMLDTALLKTDRMLTMRNYLAKGMIVDLATNAPQELREMFNNLFDESQDLSERITNFKEKAEEVRQNYMSDAKQHFQNEYSISTYLWLRYPDKYYVYKYSEAKATAQLLKGDYSIKQGDGEANVKQTQQLYDGVCQEVQKDPELKRLLQEHLTEDCYPDPEFKTLVGDIGFYINRMENSWQPKLKDYNPQITVKTWKRLLTDDTIFNSDSLKLMKRMKDCDGQASCKKLSEQYGLTWNYYQAQAVQLAQRVAKKLNIAPYNNQWWPILFMGRKANKDEEGSFVWRLREELSKALDKVDLSQVRLFEQGYWWLNTRPDIWKFSEMKGKVNYYTLYNDKGHKHQVFRNFLEVKVGDPMLVYEASPTKKIVGLARIYKENDGKQILFEKVKLFEHQITYAELKEKPELQGMEFLLHPNGSLFSLTQAEYDTIMEMIGETAEPVEQEAVPVSDTYTKDDFLNEAFISSSAYDELTDLLLNKQNLILQGAPGVGKTFVAKRLAYSLIGQKADDQIEFIQFHQNYSYEDFMMGYKPSENGFELKYGVFFKFCQKALSQPDKKFFFIIDEINRGNLSKIFGELLMLIEKDYRGKEITLAYDGHKFSVPKNLYLIGMMNTADRSLAMIDYALRRRFSFYELEPAFATDAFASYAAELSNPTFDRLIEKITSLNSVIQADPSLGKGFCIGHSYFCNLTQETCTLQRMKAIVNYDILPMLAEYWFDDTDKLQNWKGELHEVINNAG